jgi:hypothetical protein
VTQAEHSPSCLFHLVQNPISGRELGVQRPGVSNCIKTEVIVIDELLFNQVMFKERIFQVPEKMLSFM